MQILEDKWDREKLTKGKTKNSFCINNTISNDLKGPDFCPGLADVRDQFICYIHLVLKTAQNKRFG